MVSSELFCNAEPNLLPGAQSQEALGVERHPIIETTERFPFPADMATPELRLQNLGIAAAR